MFEKINITLLLKNLKTEEIPQRFKGKTRKILELLNTGEIPTCASCGDMILDEEQIIGDGTNRGLCCVPTYYDEP